MSKTISFLIAARLLLGTAAFSEAPTTLGDFFLPGSQPGQSGNIEHPDKCDNGHGGYDEAVEPEINWRGSMMAQAARSAVLCLHDRLQSGCAGCR